MADGVLEALRGDHGELHIGSGSERYIIIPLRAYAEIVNAFFKLVGEAAGGPLYFLGKRIGAGMVEELKNRTGNGVDAEKLVETYARFLSELGFGEVEIVEKASDHAVIRMRSPPSLAGAGLADEEVEKAAKAGKKVCYLEAGMIAAVFERILGGRWRGVELEHGPMEDPFCVLRVERQG